MNWIEFAVYTTDEGIEPVCGALASVNIEQVSIEESRDRVEEHLRALAPYWDFADAAAIAGQNGPCVKAYIADLPENEPLLNAAREAIARFSAWCGELSLAPPEIVETVIDEEDWANAWKRYYKPLPVGDRLLICPLWEEAGAELTQNRTVLKMDPGMVFGTGAHHTTRLCMEWIEQTVCAGDRVLDIGCGSGILAIAALLLGAKSAVCVDIDPVAERVVKENLAHNAIPEKAASVHVGNILEDTALQSKLAGRYEVVTANIVADVIIALSEFVMAYIRPGGYFICSGIIRERAEEVLEALQAAGFSSIEKLCAEETADAGALATAWVAYRAKR